MNNITQDSPDDLKDLWKDLSTELGTDGFQKHLDILKHSLQSSESFANKMKIQFSGVAPDKVDPNLRLAARKDLVSSLQVHSLTLNSVQSVFSSLSSAEKGLVQKVLDWILQNIVQVLSSYSEHLNVDSWSVEATGGLPLGVSFSVTITFK